MSAKPSTEEIEGLSVPAEDLAPPSVEVRAEIERLLAELTLTLTNHPLWRGPGINNVHKTLYEVWDFVSRTRYRLSEYDNIQHGRALRFPSQFKSPPGKGEEAALKVFQDVCGRTLLIRLLITDTTGNAAALTGAEGSTISFGEDCKSALEHLERVLPGGHMAVGVKASGLLDWMAKAGEEMEEMDHSP